MYSEISEELVNELAEQITRQVIVKAKLPLSKNGEYCHFGGLTGMMYEEICNWLEDHSIKIVDPDTIQKECEPEEAE